MLADSKVTPMKSSPKCSRMPPCETAANNPTRPSDDTYRYIFSGWTPEIVPAMKDVSYYAQYQQKDAHVFTIKWADG